MGLRGGREEGARRGVGQGLEAQSCHFLSITLGPGVRAPTSDPGGREVSAMWGCGPDRRPRST